jgi:TolA-binding protein
VIVVKKKIPMIIGFIIILSGSLVLSFNGKNKVNEGVSNQDVLSDQERAVKTHPVATQQYNEAIKFFNNEEYEKAKTICQVLIDNYSQYQVFLDEFHSKTGPAALYLLGLIAVREKNYEEATKIFQEMVEEYPNEDAIAPDAGFTLCGIAGAEGLINQIEINLNYIQDYERAYTLINQLKDRFGKVMRSHTTGPWYYVDHCPWYMETYLKKTNAPAERWEKEFRVYINESMVQEIPPDLLLKIGEKYHDSNLDDRAIEIYNEVIRKYKFSIRSNQYVVMYDCFGADAYVGLIKIYQKQNNQEQVVKMKKELKHLIVILVDQSIESQEYGWESRYKKYYE